MNSLTVNLDIIASACFAFAVIHTFLVKKFQQMAIKFSPGSIAENFFHLLGEVEVVFGIWGGIYLLFVAFFSGSANAIEYLESRNFTEPAFVFVIMVISATKPVMSIAGAFIDRVSRLLPLKRGIAFYLVALIIGPLLGSFITEPAAMTVTALLLLEVLFSQKISQKLKYATLGLLFVNVSIGGTLTPFAAPPVLMVASKWSWDLNFMLSNFGWKAVIAIVISTVVTTVVFRRELAKIKFGDKKKVSGIPMWIGGLHLLVLIGVVVTSHHMSAFVLLFMLFLMSFVIIITFGR